MVRFKNRYLYAEYLLFPFEEGSGINGTENFKYPSSAAGLANALRASIQHNFGLAAHAQLSQSLSVKYYNSSERCALIRCARNALPKVWAALASLPGGCADTEGRVGKWVWRVLAVSGSLRGCRKGAFKAIQTRITAKICCTDNSAVIKQLENVSNTIRQALADLEP